MMIGVTGFLNHYGLYLIAVIIGIAALGFAYTRTPAGRLGWHRLLLRLPVVGRINLLTELAACCRTIAMLFKIGLPLPNIVIIASQSTSNTAMAKALTEIHQEMIAGEGLSKPMARRKIFLPLMVQMVSVGEQTGKLDNTLSTVTQTYDTEADDRLKAAVGMITPAVTIVMGVVVAFIAVSLISAMYSIYGSIGG
jgi:type IV pilus assembly protein PilC